MRQSVDEMLNQALAEQRAGRPAGAERLCREILADDPRHVPANLMLGILAARSGREELAVELLTVVLNQAPEEFEALKWIAGALTQLNRDAEAVEFARRAVDLRPEDYAARLALGKAYFGVQKYDEAAQIYRDTIALDRKREGAYFGLATALRRMGNTPRALDVLRDAVREAPSPRTLLRLAEVAILCELPDEAAACAQRVLAGEPNNTAALEMLVRACQQAGRSEEEEQVLTYLMAVNPDNHRAHNLHGTRLQVLGRFEEAEAEFRRSIEIQPKQGRAYFGIVAGRRLNESDEWLVEAMERALADGNLDLDETANLRFALGRGNDQLGRYCEAMVHFEEGNRLKREVWMGSRRFDRATLTRQIDQTIALYTKEFIASNAEAASFPLTPIFIGGMVRSGTTLTEQILSCHPDVGAAGEQTFWRSNADICVDRSRMSLKRATVNAKAKEYVEHLANLAPGRPYVTDKDPGNCLVYGLIHLAFPDSPIVHMRRDPVDVAISIFTTLFRTVAEYVWDREDIVFALREHKRMQEHWKTVLPENRLLELDYRDLVTDREAATRRLVEFCGLPWNDACLTPEGNEREVANPSRWQVRQPVYTESLDRWRNYEECLGPFRELLEH